MGKILRSSQALMNTSETLLQLSHLDCWQRRREQATYKQHCLVALGKRSHSLRA